MRFETNPQLILSTDEMETLDKALKLCRDMDEQTSEIGAVCEKCPFCDNCSHMYSDCVYMAAYTALKKIIDIAVVK
jgi:hypothetical protein